MRQNLDVPNQNTVSRGKGGTSIKKKIYLLIPVFVRTLENQEHKTNYFYIFNTFFEGSFNFRSISDIKSALSFIVGSTGGEGYLTKFNTGRRRPEVQPLTLLYTFLAEKVPVLHTFY